MQKVRVEVEWCNKNFAATLGENVPGCVLVTAKTYSKLKKEVKEALAEFDQYETMHVSCLVEVGMKLIGEKAGDEAMKEYYGEHAEWFEEGKFERLRRIFS